MVSIVVRSREFRVNVILTSALIVLAPFRVLAEPGDAEFARHLVRARYFEGLPYEEARQLKPEGAAALIDMLGDPADERYAANIVMALGISGDPRAFPALISYRRAAREGEVAQEEYAALRALPLAMGHLAQSDSRALAFLIAAARAEESDSIPRWRRRHLEGRRLAGVLRRAAITGLAMSGVARAAATLKALEEGLQARPGAPEELLNHVAEARELCGRVAREGPDALFGRAGLP